MLKHTIDVMEQVAGIIRLVAEGRIIVDPKVMAGLIYTEQTVGASRGAILKNLEAMDTWNVDPPVLESEFQVDEGEAAGFALVRPWKSGRGLCRPRERGNLCRPGCVRGARVSGDLRARVLASPEWEVRIR